MFWNFVKFELLFRLKKKYMAYVFFVVFFLLSFLSITTDTVQIGGGIGNVNINSPFVILQTLIVLSVIGMFITSALMANIVIRDYETKAYPTFFTTGISKFNYLFGRFTGAYFVTLFSFFGAVLGLMLGSVMPWVDAERLGEFMLSPFVQSWFVFVMPNVFITGAFFFMLGTLSRSNMYTFVGVVMFFVAFAVSGQFLRELDNQQLAGMLDPFGIRTFALSSRYWTVIEKNSIVPPFEGTLLWNRLLWMGIAILSLAATYFRFRFAEPPAKKESRKKRKVAAKAPVETGTPKGLPQFIPNFSGSAYFKQFISLTSQEFSGIVKTVPFVALLLMGIFNVWADVSFTQRLFGTNVHLVTRVMAESITQSFSLFILIILTIYAGELIWRGRQTKVSEFYDALPVPEWVPYVSKFFALVGVILFMQLIAIGLGIIYQLLNGFTDIELSVYFKNLFVNQFASFTLLAFLVMFIHVMVDNKYLGHMAVVLFYIVCFMALPSMGYTHNLYIFSGVPSSPYSDMNGFGHFSIPAFWFNTYWLMFSGILAAISLIFWVRGTDAGWKSRMMTGEKRFSLPKKVGIAVCALAFLGTGGFIFYNTNVVNEYTTNDEQQEQQVAYEKQYKKYEGIPQPRIVDVYAEVDIFPYERDVDLRGRYLISNKSRSAIDSVHVMLNHPGNLKMDLRNLTIGKSTLAKNDERFNYRIYALENPMQPGDTLEVSFDLSFKTEGFLNGGSNTNIVYNGTFFNNFSGFPHFGYNSRLELSDLNDRREHDLPVKQRMPSIDDSLARNNTYILNDADWVNFETIVSTVPEQIAISPGYLQREWEENGRRYFHYKMDSPILNFYSYLSADYEVKRAKWNDVDIEIYYHSSHQYNLDKMIQSVQKSLDYFTENFSPYQHKQMRILEFPRYASFAQSFPNTVPYSESIGFIANLEDEDDIDYVFYVTAHEVAHQWWAHQVIGANVQGATITSETMSQYSALMVMEKEYGREQMQKFLKYEMDRYLRGRSNERIKELPIIYNENQQYIHYRKGSVIMYALKDYIGEEKLNQALAKYIDAVAFQEAPFTTSLEFLSYIREAVPDSLDYIIEDWFETITLYDNRAGDISYTKTADDRYEVTLNIQSKKLRADSLGAETPVAMSDWIDIGVLGEDDKELYLQKHKVDREEMTFTVIVDELPLKGGIDPYAKLIDRNHKDNTKAVKAVE